MDHLRKRCIILFRIVIPPPEEYQYDSHELEKRNQLLNDEVQQLRVNNQVRLNSSGELLYRIND